MGGEDGERRAEFGAQGRKLQAGAAGDFGKPDLFEGMLGEQRHQRVGRLVAVGGAARRGSFGWGAALFFRLAGHGGLLGSVALNLGPQRRRF